MRHAKHNPICFEIETPSSIGHLINSKPVRARQSKPNRYVKSETSTSTSTSSPFADGLVSLKRTADGAFVQNPMVAVQKAEAEDVQVEEEAGNVLDTAQATIAPEMEYSLSRRKSSVTSSIFSTGETPVEQKNRGGRPRTAHLKPRRSNGHAIILRKNNPVITEIPLDVWQNILAFCPLEFLVKARGVSRNFRLALSYESTWRESRMRNYGPDCPDPPAGFTEMQYADLLTGNGCQTRSCQEKARKTYWAFQRRWCESCLKQRIVMHDSCQALTKTYPELFDCIHHATFDNWDNYQCVGTYAPAPSWLKTPGTKFGYERLEIANAIEELEALRSPDARGNSKSAEELEEWFALKAKTKNDLVKKLQSIENWVELLKRKRFDEGKSTKDIRAVYFEKMAMTMNPPLELVALKKTQSFNRAILITKQPTERAWIMLKKKLEVERHLAEQIVQEDIEDKLAISESHDMFRVNPPRDHLAVPDTPDLDALFALVDDIVQRLGIKNNISTIADQDIVPLTLKEVFREYSQLERSSGPTSGISPSCLLLKDAGKVYVHKLEPILKAWDNEDRTKAATRFKCPLCTRRDVNRRWGFVGLMYHIGERHAPNTPEFGHWRIRNSKFPWHHVEWPRNIPILTDHHTATGKWGLDDDVDYQQFVRPTAVPMEKHESAFKDRRVSVELGMQGSTNNDFIQNILYAASELRTTLLAPEYKTQIVFQFALQKFQLACDTTPDFDVVEPLQVALLRAGHHTLFEGFRCQFCSEQPEPSKNNRFINKGQPFGDLMRHFSTFYHPRHEWTIRSLKFRSVEELSMALHQPEHGDALQAFDRLFPPSMEGFLNPRLVFGS